MDVLGTADRNLSADRHYLRTDLVYDDDDDDTHDDDTGPV